MITEEARRIREGAYEILAEAGIPRKEIPRTERLLSTALLGFVISEVSGRFYLHKSREMDKDFDELLSMLLSYILSRLSR